MVDPGRNSVVEPILALGQLIDQSCVHRHNEADFGGRQRAEGFGRHEESKRSRPCCLAVYLINLVARASPSGGIVTPISLAVLRFITSSNFVGCSTGRSAGLAPFRILSTKYATRLWLSAGSAP